MDFSDRPSASGRANRSEKLLTKVAKLVLSNGLKKDKPDAEKRYWDPEELTTHKREWTRRFIEGGGASRQPQWSEHLFEHFAIVGLSPTMNVRAVTADIKTYVKVNRAGGVGFEVTPDGPREKQQYGLKGPALPAEVVYNFPSAAQEAPGLPADLAASLAGFCFPAGVRPELLERTPSMSALNEVIYSQPYQTHDDQSFVFLMKVADGSSVAPRTLYGVCCYMKELLHRPPAIARPAFPACNAPLSRYMVVAPRCYCLLTYYPFFALHFRVLQTILGLERLDRMTAFAEELAAGFPPAPPSSSWRTSETNDTERAAATASSGNSLAAWDGASAYGSQGARQPPPQLPPRSTASARDSTDSSNASSAGDDTASTASTLQQQQQQQQYRPSRLGRPLGSAPQLASLQGAPQQQDDGPLAEGLRRQMSAAAAPAVPGATQITPGVGLPPPPTPFFTPRSQPLPAVLGPLGAAAAELVSPLVAGGGNRRAGQQVLSQPRQQAHQQPQQPQQQQQQPGAVAGPSAAELAAAASNGLARIASVKRALEESLAQAGDAAGADQAQQSQQHHQQWQQARHSLPPQQRGHAQQYEVAQAEPSVVSSLGEPAAGFGSAFGQADSSSSSPSLTSSLHDPRTQQRPSLPEEPAKLEQNGIHMESVPAKPAGSAEEAQQQENLLAPTETTDYGSNPSADADSLQPPGQEQRGQQQQQQQQEEERLPCGSTPSQPAASTLGAGAEASAAYAAASSSSQTPLPPQRSASSPSSPSASVPSEGGARPGAPQAGGSGSGSGYASGQEDENVGGSGPASEAGSFVTATSSMARGSASSYSDLAGLGSAGAGTATPLGTPEADGASSRGLPSPGSSCVPSPCLLTPVAGGPEALWRTGDGHQLPAGGAHMEPAAAAPAASAIGAAEEAAEGAAAGPAAGTAAAEGIAEAARASCGDVSPAPASASVAEAQQSQQQQQQQQQHPTAPRSQPGLGADAPGASGVLPLAVAGAAVSHEPPMDDARAGAPTITEAAPAPAASPQAATGGAAPDQPVVGSVTKTASFTRVEVQVSTNTYTSPQPALAASRGNTPARSDILTGTPMRPYAVPPQPPPQQPQAATAAAGAAEAALPRLQGGSSEAGSTTSSPAGSTTPTHAAGQQWQQQQQQLQQVVRVTASNLDLSRPLDSLDLLSVYHGSVVPSPGQVFEFQPDPGLQGIAFERPDLLEALKDLGLRPTAASLPDIDASQNLGGWTVAALCRSLSLSNVLAFLTAVLLERQVVVFCPNIGVLCGVVLSLVPMLLPFSWQSLLLPVLPASQQRLEIMEAPVPFVLGVLHKTAEVRGRCGGLVRVNVYKDKVKNTGSLPALPSHQALHDALLGTYSELRRIGQQRTVLTRPVHMVSDAQQVLAECFLSTLQKYFKALMADLTAYTITDVTADNDRVSVLLKDSFIDSFPPRDRAFIRQFAETQMFSVYCDAVTDNSPRV